MSDKKEVWKDVVGYEGRYQISNLGRVKSLSRLVKFPDGRKSYSIKERVLRQQIGTHGYYQVDLHNGGDRKRCGVHIMVCEAFNGLRPKKLEVCHNDGDKANNCKDNLRWDTKESNAADRVIHDGGNRGDKNGRSKLNNHKVLKIKSMIAGGVAQGEIASLFGVCQQTISLIGSGKRWGHV